MARILAFHAHPDDIETLAAGTLALLADAGCEVVIATATAGECGAVDQDPEQTARVRKGEAEAAARLIGAEYRCVGLPDLGVFNDDASRGQVTELIRRSRPDVVITASPVDYHPDHEAISELVRDGCFAASAANYRTGASPALSAIPHLYLMDPIGARDRNGAIVRPDFAVDIGAWMATKRQMLQAHQSQVDWVAKQHGVGDFLSAMEAVAARRGKAFGVDFAEGFRQYRGTPFPRSPRLQELVGEALLRPQS